MSRRPPQFWLNQSHPLAKGLVFAGFGRLTGSTRYQDSSRRLNNGVLTNMDPATDWVWSEELGRWALDFDGSNDLGIVPIGQSFGTAVTALSVAIWIKRNRLDTREFPYTNTSDTIRLEIRASNQLRFGVVQSGYKVYDSNFVIADTNWHHIVGIYNGAAIYCYLDGVRSNSQTLVTGEVDATSDLGIGGGSGIYFQGKASDAVAYRSILSPTEIVTLADRSNPMLDGLIQAPGRRRSFISLSSALTLPNDTFANASPWPNGESIGTVVASGGSPPYSYQIISQGQV